MKDKIQITIDAASLTATIEALRAFSNQILQILTPPNKVINCVTIAEQFYGSA